MTHTPQSDATIKTTLTINGKRQTVTADPRTTLLDALRHHLGLHGSKKGCDHGQCGACTVMINGERINSCLALACMHDGDEVTTVEGLGQPGNLSPMQNAFVRHDGYQCGYCTPGQVVSATAMLSEAKRGWPSFISDGLDGDVALTTEEISERMSGNLCRCSAYPGIVNAILDVDGQQPEGEAGAEILNPVLEATQ